MSSTSLSAGGALSIVPTAVLAGVLVFFLVLAVVGIFVVVVVANRADPDPAGRRPLVVYYFAVSFFAVFATLFGSFGVIDALVQLIGNHAATSGLALHPIGDAVARAAVVSGIFVVIGATLLTTHFPRGLALAEGADSRRGPAGRVAQSYVAAVTFVAVFIASGAAVVLVYQVVQILGPGVFELSGTRVDALRVVLGALYLVLAAGIVAAFHVSLLPPDLRSIGPGRPPSPSAPYAGAGGAGSTQAGGFAPGPPAPVAHGAPPPPPPTTPDQSPWSAT
jgi:hypothetical protein